MGDGAGAKAGLIGKDAAGDALLHADEQAADGAAGEGSGVEGTGHDGLQHIGQAGQVEPYYAHSQHDVEQRHEGHQLFAHAADALDAAQQHHGHQHGHDDARDEVQRAQETAAHHTVFQQGGVHGGHDGVDLGGIAGAEHGQHAEQRVQKCQELPALAQTVLDVIHGAAHPLAGLTALTEMHGQGHLGKLGAHAQQRGAPHPEHGTRAAVPASAVHTAWKGVMAPSEASFLRNMRPMVVLMVYGNLRICKKPVRTLSSKPTPMMHTMAGTPQIKLLTAVLTAVIVSIIIRPTSSVKSCVLTHFVSAT